MASRASIKPWLKANGYLEILALIEEIEAEWKVQKERDQTELVGCLGGRHEGTVQSGRWPHLSSPRGCPGEAGLARD